MSDDDPIRWAEGGGPPGALELVRAIERTPAVPPALRSSMTRRLGPRQLLPRTRMIGGAVATAVVLGGLALWIWPRPHEPLVREPAAVASSAEAMHAVAPLVGQSTPVAVTAPVGWSAPVAVTAPVAPVVPAVGQSAPVAVRRPVAAVVPPAVDRVDEHPMSAPTPEVPFDPDAELSPAQLRTVVTRNRPGLQHCYELAARESGSTETMRATIDIAIDRSGVVTRANITAPGAPPQLATCFAAQVRGWQFPARGEATFPVVFSASSEPGPVWPVVAPLHPGEPTGYLTLNSSPWSRVFLDGNDTGQITPLLRLRVRAGLHRVGFWTADGEMTETAVQVRVGETTTVVRQLDPATGAADRLERARLLMLQGNNNGVIALLQGARSQQELELLIATYTNIGNTVAKLAAMRRYIERFPTSPKARNYRQVVLGQPQRGAIDEDE